MEAKCITTLLDYIVPQEPTTRCTSLQQVDNEVSSLVDTSQ